MLTPVKLYKNANTAAADAIRVKETNPWLAKIRARDAKVLREMAADKLRAM